MSLCSRRFITHFSRHSLRGLFCRSTKLSHCQCIWFCRNPNSHLEKRRCKKSTEIKGKTFNIRSLVREYLFALCSCLTKSDLGSLAGVFSVIFARNTLLFGIPPMPSHTREF